MRYLIAATAFTLLATPAFAQRVDTVRLDRSGSNTMCVFRAVPDLWLNYYGSPSRTAVWEQRTPGANYGEEATLRIAFIADPASPFGVTPEVAGISIGEYSGILERVVRARIEVDGRDIGIPPSFDPPPPPVTHDDNEDQILVTTPRTPRPVRGWVPSSWRFDGTALQTAAAGRMTQGKSLEILLYDKHSQVIGRYRWDISKVRRVPELLSLVDWSCTAPARDS